MTDSNKPGKTDDRPLESIEDNDTSAVAGGSSKGEVALDVLKTGFEVAKKSKGGIFDLARGTLENSWKGKQAGYNDRGSPRILDAADRQMARERAKAKKK